MTTLAVLWLAASLIMGKLIRWGWKKGSLKAGFIFIGISFILGMGMLFAIIIFTI